VGRQIMTKAEHDVERCVAQLRHDALSRLQSADHSLSRCLYEVQQLTLRRIAEVDQSLEASLTTMQHFGQQRLGEAEQAIEALAREVLGLGPQATLQRGFALVRDGGGMAISSVAAAENAKALDIEFRDGSIRAEVTSPLSGTQAP
jgi:exodeoxyribonuclease VII large subunit